MNIDRVADGDIIEAVRRDRRFLARVTGREGAKLTLVPLTHNTPYYFAHRRHVRLHWARRPKRDGRTRTRAIRPDDLIAFTPNGHRALACVLQRQGSNLQVRGIGPAASPQWITTSAVNDHFALRGRRRGPA
jgi:hypothetical protein